MAGKLGRGKKKQYKKKYVAPKRTIGPLGRTSKFIRGCYVGTITSSVSAVTYGSYSFSLADLPSSSEFTNLFDEYKIAKITLQFIPAYVQVNNTVGKISPWFMYCIDKDDVATPSTYTTILQYPSHKVISMTKGFTVSFAPRVATALYNGGVTTAYGSDARFIDTASDAVPHYGFKYGVDLSTDANSYKYNIFAKYTIHVRGVR